ncbi:MAG: PHP domain-containing protein, partial [Bacteroidota bacterium]
MFTHLHVHSNFSLLDGAATVTGLTSTAAAQGMRALALTDHDGLYGAVRFYQAAQAAGVKPIIGVEVTVETVQSQYSCHPERSEGPRLGEAAPFKARSFAALRMTKGGAQQSGLGAPPTDSVSARDTCTDVPSTGRRDACPTGKACHLPHPTHLVLLAEDNEGYSNLCRLVTAARLGQAQSAGPFAPEYADLDRTQPLLSQEHLRQYCSHLIALSGCECGEINQLLLQGDEAGAEQVALYYKGLFGPGNFYIELQNTLLPPPRHRLRYELAELAGRLGLPIVATNNVHYVSDDRARLQDMLVCIRHNQSVDEPHPDRKPNWEYALKSPAQMGELFAEFPEALQATEEIAERCNWTLDLGRYHFPRFDLEGLRRECEADELGGVSSLSRRGRLLAGPPYAAEEETSSGNGVDTNGGPDSIRPLQTAGPDTGRYPPPQPAETSRDYLRRICYTGAKWRYGDIRPDVGRRLEHELGIIEQKGLCDYFLIVWDIVRFARSRRIRATGRGSAGDSIVSYVLDLTHADPLAHDLLFERFLNPERHGMPDIDVDFCARRRDEVTAYVYERYGAEHVAAVCTLNTFRARSALREIGKALAMD